MQANYTVKRCENTEKTIQQNAQNTLTVFVYSDIYSKLRSFRRAKYMRFFEERTN